MTVTSLLHVYEANDHNNVNSTWSSLRQRPLMVLVSVCRTVKYVWTKQTIGSSLLLLRRRRQGQGDVHIPVTARPAVLPSVYSGHPSYAFPQGRDYAEDRDYPANPTYADIFCDDQDARAYPVPALKTREERANYAGV